MCGILKNKPLLGIFNAIFITGSRHIQNAIFGRVVPDDIVSDQKIRILKKSTWSEIMGAPITRYS